MNNFSVFKKSIIVTHLFYLVLFVLFFNRYTRHLFSTNTYTPSEFIEILRWLPQEYFFWFKKIVAGIGFISFAACAIYPWSRILRILVFLSLLLIIGIESSYGKVMHGHYGWAFASLAMIFLPRLKHPYKENLSTEAQRFQTSQVLFCAQFSAIICYAMAGLWKVRHIPIAYSEGGIYSLMHALGNTIAYEHVTFAHTLSPISQFFLDHDYITGCLFLGLVALQTLSPLAVMFTSFHFALGLFLLTFHILSEIIVKIPFRPQMYLVIIFFLFSPFIQWPGRNWFSRLKT